MPTVATVRLRYVPKQLWFDPNGVDVNEGDHVVVETERGTEIGLSVAELREVDEKDLAAPLKPILRLANEEDFAKADEMARLGEDAMEPFRELVKKHDLDMKPISVDFLLTGDRAVFYFAAEERIDFRSLVRELASRFHVRVDMRQIGVRDESRMLGGFGHCGEELCCHRMGGEFQPVSIRMAKEQDLPLNPTKISGLCGRLMCCLRYEFEAYKDFKSRAPKKNSIIDTPIGLAKVVEFDTPRESLRLRMEDGKSIHVPLASMDCDGKEPKEGEKMRPCHISQDAFDQIMEELHKDDTLAAMGEKLFSDDASLADTVAPAGVAGRTPRRKKQSASKKSNGASSDKRASDEMPGRSPRKRRRRVSINPDSETGAVAVDERDESTKDKPRQPKGKGQRRSSKPRSARQPNQGADAKEPKGNSPASKAKVRPGQKSSSLSGEVKPAEQRKPRRRRRRPNNSNDAGGSSETPTSNE